MKYDCPHRASLVAQLVKNPPAMWETKWVFWLFCGTEIHSKGKRGLF